MTNFLGFKFFFLLASLPFLFLLLFLLSFLLSILFHFYRILFLAFHHSRYIFVGCCFALVQLFCFSFSFFLFIILSFQFFLLLKIKKNRKKIFSIANEILTADLSATLHRITMSFWFGGKMNIESKTIQKNKMKQKLCDELIPGLRCKLLLLWIILKRSEFICDPRFG